jgi:transposase
MRPVGSPEELERRRRRAIGLLEKELSQSEVARRVGCHASSVLRWERDFRRGGAKALNPKPAPGRPPRLTGRQKQRLVGYLLEGAPAHGYKTDLWTTMRIAKLISNKFGVRYHRDHVGRLLHGLGWSCQKPERRAIQRNEAAIGDWKTHDWPRIKKTPCGWAPISPS